MNKPPLIEVDKVTKSYGALNAVCDVDLTLFAGQCHALVGHNGAGKSTLLKMILGLARVTSGRISVLGIDPKDRAFDQARTRIGFLPEQALFQGTMSGIETLKFYARLKGAPREDLGALFRRVDLVDAAGKRVATYSKGMRQRLGLAQALIGDPKLLILDEPTSGLDPASRKNVYQIIDDVKSRGSGVLISSHALSELDSKVDEVTILDHGLVAASGTIAKLRAGAGLPSQIRIQAGPKQMPKLAKYFAGAFDSDCFVNGTARLDCPPDGKMHLLREIMDLGATYDDIELVEPSLEEVFAAYTKSEPRQ
ncbi:MAG: ABC transporter ATP-binding protein [Fimbriimonadaceae bacterium]|nr:ABC transporter ATP-binding protein [Alphaproteobacteria bacterium]